MFFVAKKDLVYMAWINMNVFLINVCEANVYFMLYNVGPKIS